MWIHVGAISVKSMLSWFLLRLAKEAAKPDAVCKEEMNVFKQPRFLSGVAHLTTTPFVVVQNMFRLFCIAEAAIAQLEKHQTEDLKVPDSISGLGIVFGLHLSTKTGAQTLTALWCFAPLT